MPEEVARKSSFARAFFASGAGGEDLSGPEGAGGATAGKNVTPQKQSATCFKVLYILNCLVHFRFR
jgi:hypothetical protein